MARQEKPCLPILIALKTPLDPCHPPPAVCHYHQFLVRVAMADVACMQKVLGRLKPFLVATVTTPPSSSSLYRRLRSPDGSSSSSAPQQLCPLWPRSLSTRHSRSTPPPPHRTTSPPPTTGLPLLPERLLHPRFSRWRRPLPTSPTLTSI
jgi:hypothetical protein